MTTAESQYVHTRRIFKTLNFDMSHTQSRSNVLIRIIFECQSYIQIMFLPEEKGEIGNVCEEKYRPSPIPKGCLEIILDVELKFEDAKRRILERFQNIIESNYENNITGECPIYDQAV